MNNWKKLMEKLLPAALAVSTAFTMAVGAFASDTETVPTQLTEKKKEYSVTFSSDKKMQPNYSKAEMYEEFMGMQPGDSTDIVMNLKNEYSDTVDWYMTNKVLKSLEDTRDNAELAGGAYTYRLTYKGPTSEQDRVLFDSDTVGGEDQSVWGQGLHEATGALEDWLYLDTYKNGQGGQLVLTVALDGETQNNDYQDTLAELKMNFAVELNTNEESPSSNTGSGGGGSIKDESREPSGNGSTNKSGGGSSNRSSSSSSGGGTQIVRTGDYTDTIPYLIAAGVSGLILLILAIYSVRERRRQKGGRA